jgi:hypothetical protein
MALLPGCPGVVHRVGDFTGAALRRVMDGVPPVVFVGCRVLVNWPRAC